VPADATPAPPPAHPQRFSPRRPARVVVLLSGAGTLCRALLDAAADPRFGASVVAVGTDRADAAGLRHADEPGVATFVEPLDGHPDRQAWDEALATRVEGYHPDLVVLAGFLRLVGPAFLARFGGRCVNSHPALSPAFPGAHAVRDALAYGVHVTGTTLFLVDAGVDTGAVVAQRAVDVHPDDDEATLHERIKQHERRMLVDVVGRMARDGWTVSGRKVTIP
jgi:phosphoribosylglycinamide formyltransferase-1